MSKNYFETARAGFGTLVGKGGGKAEDTCSHCGKKGHKAADCWSKNSSQADAERKCFVHLLSRVVSKADGGM